ncbi:MAG: hypothetical protein EOP53_03795 [Sphingobacteriales bacterium]|nr:MAG: hypothetical protein EOP53_03795 [Sphingobacteriales bacterium]
MKKHFLAIPYMVIVFAATLSLAGCKDGKPSDLLPKSYSFDLEKSLSFDLQKAPALGQITLSDVKLSIDMDSALAANGLSSFTVSKVQTRSVAVNTETPGANLDAFDSLALFVTASNLPEARIAYKYGIPNDIKSLDMDVDDVNIAEYLKEKPTNLKIKATLGDSIKQDMTLNANIIFKIDVSRK